MEKPLLIVKPQTNSLILNKSKYVIIFNTVEIIVEGKQKKAIYNVTHQLEGDTWHTQHTFDDFSKFNDFLIEKAERNGIPITHIPEFPRKGFRGRFIVDNKPTLHRRLKGLQEYFTLLLKLKIFNEEVGLFFKASTNLERSHSLGSLFNEWIIDCSEIEKKDKLGSGSFSDVYLGFWKGRKVAIKVFKPSETEEQENRYQKFVAESSLMKNLSHRNVVKFYGISSVQSNYEMVIEYVEKGDLFKIMRSSRYPEVPLSQKVLWTLQIAQGMKYLHQFKPPILHRDLKSPNIMIDKDNIAKIGDFGLAKVQEDRLMTICGSPVWIAPEMIRNEAYTEQVDVYAFGIILFEIFSGEIPYQDINVGNILALGILIRDGLRPKVPPSAPEFYADLMRRCWHDNPNSRPTFNQIVQLIEDYIASQGSGEDGGYAGMIGLKRNNRNSQIINNNNINNKSNNNQSRNNSISNLNDIKEEKSEEILNYYVDSITESERSHSNLLCEAKSLYLHNDDIKHAEFDDKLIDSATLTQFKQNLYQDKNSEVVISPLNIPLEKLKFGYMFPENLVNTVVKTKQHDSEGAPWLKISLLENVKTKQHGEPFHQIFFFNLRIQNSSAHQILIQRILLQYFDPSAQLWKNLTVIDPNTGKSQSPFTVKREYILQKKIASQIIDSNLTCSKNLQLHRNRLHPYLPFIDRKISFRLKLEGKGENQNWNLRMEYADPPLYLPTIHLITKKLSPKELILFWLHCDDAISFSRFYFIVKKREKGLEISFNTGSDSYSCYYPSFSQFIEVVNQLAEEPRERSHSNRNKVELPAVSRSLRLVSENIVVSKCVVIFNSTSSNNENNGNNDVQHKGEFKLFPYAFQFSIEIRSADSVNYHLLGEDSNDVLFPEDQVISCNKNYFQVDPAIFS